MSLLHFFKPRKPEQHIVLHVDHGLRECAKNDALFVQEQSAKHGFSCKTVVLNPGQKQGNVQAWARTARYQAARELAQQSRFNWIVTAHTLDDWIENVYMQAVQGRGYFRRSSIPRKRGPVLRPLLAWTRQELQQGLSSEDVAWVEDPSNAKEHYLRNWIRHNTLASETDDYYRNWAEATGDRGQAVQAAAHRVLMRITGACAAVCVAIPTVQVPHALLPVLVQEWLARKGMRIRDEQLEELCTERNVPATAVCGGMVCRLDSWIWAVSEQEKAMLATRTLQAGHMPPLGFTQSALDKGCSVLTNSSCRKGYPATGHFQEGGMTRSAKNVFRKHGIPAFLRADCFWFLQNGNPVFELSVRNRKTPVLLLPCAHTIEDKR